MKVVLFLAVLAGVGWYFLRILQHEELRKADPSRSPARLLWDGLVSARPGGLAASAGLYLLGLSFWAGFWIGLLRYLGQRPSTAAAVRAYFVGQLGKYVPGKALALVIRATLVHGPGVRLGVAAQTALYETLTSMAAGAFVAVLLFSLTVSDSAGRGWLALGLLAVAGIPILPGVFNRVVRKLSAPLLEPGAEPLPPLRPTTLAAGLVVTSGGWLFLGVSLWAMLQAVLPSPRGWDGETVARCTAFIGLAYVAGFLLLVAPGGLGVRDGILQQLLAQELSHGLGREEANFRALVAVLLLRLLWTAAEVIMAGAVWWLPGPARGGEK